MNLVNGNKKIWYPGIFPVHDIYKEASGFAKAYDEAQDKAEFRLAIGDTVVLHNENIALYAGLTKAMGITESVESDTNLYLMYHHSNQGGINRKGDRDCVNAMTDYLIQTYINVSTN